VLFCYSSSNRLRQLKHIKHTQRTVSRLLIKWSGKIKENHFTFTICIFKGHLKVSLPAFETISLPPKVFISTFSCLLKQIFNYLKIQWGRVLAAHTCNPSYLRGWDQKDQGSRPAWVNRLEIPTSKVTRAKWTGGVAQAVHFEKKKKPWVETQLHKTTKRCNVLSPTKTVELFNTL
jgi:hypothetical protein